MSALHRFRSSLLVAVAVCASASLLPAAIVMNANSSPTAATVGDTVKVTGVGFPVPNLPNTSVSVTITCPPGNGGAVTANSSGVLNLAGQKIISFQIPPALSTNLPVVCQVTVAGTLPSVYSSGASSSTLTINPPPTVSSVTPGAATAGTTVTGVTIVGNFTHFNALLPTQPTVTVAGGGVTVTAVSATDPTHLTATITIDPAAVTGPRLVTVHTGPETANLANGFLVATGAAITVGLTPASAAQGTTLDLHVTGTASHFLNGVTLATLGDTVKINSVTVPPGDPLHATVNVTVDPIAILGPRTLTITTGGEYGTLANAFTVTQGPASLTSILPTGGAQGTSATVTFNGSLTNWVSAGSHVTFGGGIVVGNVAVTGNFLLTANISIPNTTAAGTYAATVTTNGETVTIPNAFTVTLATPFLSNVNPTAGLQGQTNLDVNLTGTFTTFQFDTPTANFGSNIHVNSITVTDNTHLKINISIDNTAFAGGRTASLTSHGTIFNFSFTVNASPTTSITGISPASGFQGASVAIQVTGSNTHWVDGLTQAVLDVVWITINKVKVTSLTSAEVDISISPNAPTGARTVTLTTGGEIVSFNSFTVLPKTPTMSINPSSGMIGTSLPVVFNGSFTQWVAPIPAVNPANSPTVANISGQGVSITGFTIDSPVSAHATLVIDPTAPVGGCNPGNRVVTLTTVSGVINEIDTAPFCVTSTPAVLTYITPSHSAVPATNLNVTITGQFTHFDGTTTVGFGPNITVGTPFSVTPTSLTVTINIAANAALGWRQAFVNTLSVPQPGGGTGPEQLSIGFNLDYPATSILTSITPSTAAQGQTLSGVTITGNLTNWVQNNTLAIVGLGITVSNLNIVSPNTATADISVLPTTPTGGRSVVMITNSGGEVESGVSFNVTPSIASVTTIGINTDCTAINITCPASPNVLADINQGDTKSFRVVGVATNFHLNQTTLDFGPGISITQVHVLDATHLYGQISVSYQAPTGFRNFRAITDGEIAPSFSNSVNVHSVTGTISLTPTTAPQGTVLNITVNGLGSTHFDAANSSATFGNSNGIIGQTGLTSTLSGADITVNSATQMVLHVIVQGTAYPGLRNLTVTTTGVIGAPQNIEQINLPLSFSVSTGVGIITLVSPNQDLQGHSVNLQVTGQNTNFQTGVTTAYLTTGGCTPASPAGATVTNVTASDHLHATLAVAIDVNAATGIRGLCMYTLGEAVGFLNAFNVLPGVPTMNGVGPVSGLQGQTLTGVALLGNFTHWTAAGPTPTTVTFGQGITVSNLQIVDNTHATVNLAIDPLAQTGGRNVVVTTGTEVVQGNLFTVNLGPAILSSISPTHANQGQHILMQVTGQFTNWAQGLTQFSIGGGDITVNGFLIQSHTSALADLTVSPTANLGTRTVTMSTAGEVVSLSQGFLVTGGIPSLISISPSAYQQCASNVNVQISGAFTKWLTGGGPATSAFFGPNITVNSVTVNDDSNLTAVISVACGAPLGLQGIVVQGKVVQQGSVVSLGLPGQIQILSNAPPTPYISYESPGVALKGQTLTVTFAGAYTNWLPGGSSTPTQITMGTGITVNNFQVTGLTSATANITIQPTATLGNRTVIFTTGPTEVETTSFYVTVGTPAISLVDGPNGGSVIQGQTLLVNLVGAYTTWHSGATTFDFGAGITITPGSVVFFGPTAARMQITADILTNVGGRTVTATTGLEVAYGYFAVSPSTATITSVNPNTVMQGTNGFVTHVHGFNTHWTNATNFTFGGSDVGVTSVNPATLTATDADLTLNLAPLAYPGLRNVTATTGGEVATMYNAFVVTPGTPILTNCVNCQPGQGVFQQHAFLTSVLGQFTAFVAGYPAAGATVVDLGNGSHITSITVTGPQSVDIGGTIDPLAYQGCRDVTVTTGAQVLKLYGAFCIGTGPAVISTLNPNTAVQGVSLNVDITGTNTNFCCVNPPNITVGSFGPGISLNTLTVHSLTSATANITIAANATAQQNNVTLVTQGESATIPLGFTIGNSTPVVSFIFGTSGAQGTAQDISVQGAFTHWSLANTTADFGAGITATVTAATATTATVHVVVSTIAATGNHAVRMVTNLGGGGQEIAVYTIGAGNGTPGYYTVNASAAAISSATPTSPASVHQNDNGDIIAVLGVGTHFTLGTPAIAFCSGVHTVAFQVVDDLHLNATVNVDAFATTGACGVSVTTGGEVASGTGLFNVLAGIPLITSLSATSAHQGDSVSVTVAGQYTHFTAASTADFGPGITAGAPTSVSSGSATFALTIDPAAAVSVRAVTVNSPGPEAASKAGAFSVLAGVPQITSSLPANGAQGLTQNMTILGLFTHFSAASVITVSPATGVTVSNPPTSPDNLTLHVNFLVTVGAPAGPRTVTVTTGGEVVSLPAAFNVLPGSPNLSSLSPNIGAPNSTVVVTFTGVFTHFTNGSTTAYFGPFVNVNHFGVGVPGKLTVSDNFTATATLDIAPGATLGAYDVVLTTPAPPLAVAETFTVSNGFTIQSSPSTPVITFLSPSMGLSGTVSASNVPTNTNVTVVFNEPMKASTITPANAFVTDGTTQGGCWATSGIPAPTTLDLSGRILTISLPGLSVGRTYYLQLNSYSVPGGTPTIQDASGTQSLGHYCQSFSTGFSPDPVGPTFITGNIPAGSTGVPTNVHPAVGFDKPVNPATIAGLSFVSNPGAAAVPGSWSYSSDFTQYIFTPASSLSAAVNYTVGYTAVLADSGGHALTNPGSFSFTTGAGPDNTGPSVISITPLYNQTVSTNPILRFVTNKPMNPLSVTQMYVYNQISGAYNFGTVTHSADFKTWNLQLSAPLDVSTQYRLNSYSMYDWAGNCCVSFNQYFYTGPAADVTPLTVLSVSPPNLSTAIAVNAPVWVRFSKPIDPTQVPANAITLNGGTVAGAITFAAGPDLTTLIFTPSANLAASTTYNLAIAGVQDQSGNPLAAFLGSSFQTAASATPDTTHGTITITPTGANVPVNTNVVFQLNKPVDPLSINSQSVRVLDNTNGGHDVPGTVAISANLMTLTFTATNPLPSNHSICAYGSYNAYLYDLAGNTFNNNTPCFTTSNTADLTAPTVISVSPPAVTGIGPNNPVVLTFSKPINPGTIAGNVAMYTGSTLYTSGYSLSGDSTTVYFSIGNMPYNTVFTVVAGPNITDLAGNHLAAEFRSSFTTAPQPVVQRPTVNAIRPSNGATGVLSSSAVTFFTSAALNMTTVNASSVHVSENGTLKTGTIAPPAGNSQAITFTPTTPFAAGALIEIWFTSAAQDASGNALYDYYAHFTVAPDLTGTPLTVISQGPCYGNCGAATNAVVEVLFSKPVNPATVTSSSFFVSAGFAPGSPINGVISFMNNNRMIRFTPNAPGFALNSYFSVYLASSIQGADGLAFAGSATSYNFYSYVSNPANNTPPFVTGLAPTNGAGSIGTNALVSVTFSSNMDPRTLDPANVTLTGPGGSIPLSISYNASSLTMTITPQAPLPPGANVALQLNGVSDSSGNALSPTPYNSSFITAGTPDYAGPVVVLTSLQPSQSNVPLTSGFSVTFNKPIDLRSVVLNSTIYFHDATLGYADVPFNLSWSAGNTTVLMTPTPASGVLSVGHQYRVLMCSLADLNGNVSSCILNHYFNTVLVAPGGGPAITQFLPPDTSTNVPENFKPQVQFDRPIQPGVLGGVTFVKMPGAVAVPMSAQLSAGGTILTLVPNTILLPNTQYIVTAAGVVDAAGNLMAGSATRHFTTGPSIDLVAPLVTSVTPIYYSTVGTNPLLKLSFNKPINPISATSFALYQYGINRYKNQLNLVWAADLKSVTFTYPGSLDPNDHYYFYLNGFADLAGNTANSPTTHFFTSSGLDNTPLNVTTVSPTNAMPGVPVNAAISIRLNKPAAPTSVSNTSVTLVGVGSTTATLAADGMSISLGLPSLLVANTTYTVQVLGGAFTDLSGNAVTAFSSTFTTSVSALSDTSHGGVTLTDPSPGATGTVLSKVITVTFSKPFNPNSILPDSFVVCIAGDCNRRIAGTVAIVDPNHLSFTPAVALPPGSTISVYVYPFTAYMTDLAGNPFDSPYLYSATFSTASVVDNTPPSVTNMTPAAGATGVGPLATVALTFNKSLDSSTVNTSNFALYQGPNNLGANVSISSDRRTVYLSQTLPFNLPITVTANTNVKDYAGNSMTAPYSANFTTKAQPLSFNPSVIQTRPGNGAPLNSAITVFTNSQINLTSAQNGLSVAQNGALVTTGTISLTADQHGIVWTPSVNFLPGAYIEVFITATITDLNLNPINATGFAFTTTQTACATPATTGYAPGRYSGGNYISNQTVEIQFCGPLSPATVTSSTFKVTTGSGPGGSAVSGTVSVAPNTNNTVIRFKPAADWSVANYFWVTLTSGIQDAAANPYAGDGYYFYVQGTAVHDGTPPAVSTVTPYNGATGIGDNAPVRIVFNKAIDVFTANPSTITLHNGGNIPYTYTFNSAQTVMNILPLAPLPDSTLISVDVSAGVTDYTGTPIADFPITFTTGAGADFAGPYVIQQSIDNSNNSSVPTNSTFSVTFNKPLDPSTVSGNPTGNNGCCFLYYDSTSPGGFYYPASTANLSPDLRTVTIVPSANLTPSNSNMRFYWQGAADLNGNAMQNGSQFFTSGAGTDFTPPTVVQSNPVNNALNAPTNSVPEIIFNKAVRATSLNQITLNGLAVTAVLNNAVYGNDTVVKLVPATLLAANTLYTVVVTGVQDVRGNTMAGSYSFQFTTGPNFNINNPNFISATVTNNTPATVPLPEGTNVANVLKVNPTFTFVWDQGIDFASLAGAIQLTDSSNTVVNVPLIFTYPASPDQKTISVQVNGALTGGTPYKMFIRLSGYPVSLSGVYDYNQRQFPFTTEP